jgi:GTP-binding protein HflX
MDKTGEPLKAILVSIQLPKVSDQEMNESLAELERLVNTMGCQVIGRMSQRRDSDRNLNVLGDGKLKELASWTGGSGVIGPGFVKKKHKAALRFEKNQSPESQDVDTDDANDTPAPQERAQMVVFDCELSPSQLRNLESATGVEVLDRTGVIIEIFRRHARTRAAKLQVEIARLKYTAPRLRETGGDESHGAAGRAGESSLELDRRHIRDRLKELREELDSIAQDQDTRRERRGQEITVALVGYTNAGKSSLMRALTASEVLVEDKLFATLDTTVRMLQPESKPRILISDTVGFIKKLPHDLVASFKSTLDEATHASLLLYVVDSSDASFRSQLEVTRQVLSEVGAGEIPSLLILNKVDRLSAEQREALTKEFPEALQLSAKSAADVADLRLRLIAHFETSMVDEDLFIPYTTQGAVGELRTKWKVLGESYSENGVTFKVRAHRDEIARLKERYQLKD